MFGVGLYLRRGDIKFSTCTIRKLKTCEHTDAGATYAEQGSTSFQLAQNLRSPCANQSLLP